MTQKDGSEGISDYVGGVMEKWIKDEFKEPRSLNAPIHVKGEELGTLEDMVRGEDGRVVTMDRLEVIEFMEIVEEVLSFREKLILEKRIGEEWTLEAVGKKLGLSRERVRQIEAEIIEKLRAFYGMGKHERRRLLKQEALRRKDMPVKVDKRGEKYRIVESGSGKIAKTSQGNPRDGGGHQSRKKAEAQARAINASREK